MSAISCQQRQFGTLETGQKITCYSLRNTSGMTVNLLDYGAILNTVQIPDLRGEMHKITLERSQLADLQTQQMISGHTVAHLPERYGITFDNVQQSLWEAESITHNETASIKLSVKGSMGLPYSATNLDYEFITEYTLTATNELIVRSQIQTSIPLPIFLTHHPIWNLTGAEEGDINDHVLQLWASHYSSIDKLGFTDENYADINNQPAFNFQKPQRIGEKQAQVSSDTPYDVCFTVTKPEEALTSSSSTPLVARVKAPVSGRTLEVYSIQEGLRFYLEPSDRQTLRGFCLAPMPLLSTDSKPAPTIQVIQQETRYKLIW